MKIHRFFFYKFKSTRLLVLVEYIFHKNTLYKIYIFYINFLESFLKREFYKQKLSIANHFVMLSSILG